MKEIWKDIKGYEGYYQISNLGNIRSLFGWNIHKGYFNRLKTMHPTLANTGYLVVNLTYKNSKIYQIHRLVAEAFIPNSENKPCINHKDGNKQNNKVDNLEWCTYSENEKHAYSINLKVNPNIGKFGNLHWNSKSILQIDKSTNKIINRYDSIMSAERDTGIPNTNICKCCKGVLKSAGGYIWKYEMGE